jgi:predicted DNA-binding protein
MATKMPRLNVVLERPIYFTIVDLAKRDGTSLSLKARDLIKQAIEFCEDAYWAKQADTRERTLRHRKTISHKAVWGK